MLKLKDLKGAKPSEIRGDIEDCLRAKPEPVPGFIWGPPGIGKSSIVHQIVKARGWDMVDLRMYLLNPVDLRGIPVADLANKQAEWLVPKFMPKSGKGILFLDELNAAPQAVQAAAYQLIYDRRCGDYVLPDGWAMLAAGNRAEDRALTFEMPSALRRRLTHMEMRPDVDEWCGWAMATEQAPEVVGFIRWRGEDLLFQFDPKIHTRSFPCPGTWGYVSQLIRGGMKVSHSKQRLIAGAVAEAAATEFVAFVQVFGELPNAEEILWDGQLKIAAPKKDTPDRLYAFTAALASAASRAPQEKSLEAGKRLLVYVADQMPPEYAVKTVKDYTQTPAYQKLKKALAATSEAKKFVDKFGPLISEA